MTVLLFVLTIMFFLGIEWLVNRKRAPRPHVHHAKDIMFDNQPGLGFTMADGGTPYVNNCPHAATCDKCKN
jgi:hypothetical protein